MRNAARRALAPIVQLREGETATALLLFTYSFLAMTAYNIIKPVTRSKFIGDLGADNLPYVLLVAGVAIAIVMTGYTWVMARLPRRWALPISQAAMSALLVLFWFLFKTKQDWVSVAFYLVGLILGVLLTSQFWTLANVIYDPRQAKRIFGFIGGGLSLGGIAGSAILTGYAKQIGTENLLLYSAAFMALCVVIVSWVVGREQAAEIDVTAGKRQKGVGAGEALQLLRQSKHLQVIALVIAFAAIGAAIIEQQLNMAAAQAAKAAATGSGAEDAMTSFLGQVQLWTSVIGFVIQVWLTSRIHRYLGIGFALMILPVSLGTTGVIMLVAGAAALWAPSMARVADQSLRYTIDKTTREILFLPLAADIKHKAKPFVDVTVDRVSKGLGAVLLLVLIKPWGLKLTWPELSYASVTLTAAWVFMAIRAKREYLSAFRRAIERREADPAEIRSPHADLQSIETLIEELADPDETRVLYAIELLESLDKRHLITPLLLHHVSPHVRVRTLRVLQSQRTRAARWIPSIERLLTDDDADVRGAAVRAIAAIQGRDAAASMREHLSASDPRMIVTAAAALASSAVPSDVDAAEEAMQRLLADTRDECAPVRREIANALGQLPGDRFRDLLVPLLLDSNTDVARAAIDSAGRDGHAASGRFLFVPPLVSLLRHATLKEDARNTLVGYGQDVVEPLAYFLNEQNEQIWVRRHLPATLARIPCQQSVDALVEALSDRDEFLRHKIVIALEGLRRSHPNLIIKRDTIEKLALDECRHYFEALTLGANLSGGGDTVLTQSLVEQQRRLRDRIFRLLGLIYPQKDMNAARFSLEQGDNRGRASASEYLDNVLSGVLGKRVMLMVEDMPPEERVRRINTMFKTRRRDVEDTLAQLIHDEDQVVAASAVHMAAERGVGTLADDMEFVLTRRDPRDWYVFEAASWALASTHMAAEERRARWLEPLPAVEIADRLRHIPLFEHVSMDELFRLAGTGRQMRHGRGRTVCAAGRTPDALHLLVDGEVAAGDGVGVQAPAALAFDELIRSAPVTEEIRAVDVATTLALSGDELLTLLSNNVELADGLFRMLLDASGGSAGARVLRALKCPDVARRASGRLTPVERVLYLRSSPLLTRATGDHLLALAAIAREVPLNQGADLALDAHESAIYVVVAGSLALNADGLPTVNAGPGDTVGAYATLTGSRTVERMSVAESGTALRLDRLVLVDLLADHVHLLQGILGSLPRGVES